jgi:NlpC/P60 family putative phage cell wall peptidase
MTMNDTIVASARGWIGTPYQHQTSLKGVGCDCLGLIRGVWREVIGMEPEAPPPYSPDWAEAQAAETLADAAGRHLIPVALDQLVPGHVVLFRWREGLPAKHCAILCGSTRMIHAHEGASVTEVPLSLWWKRRISFVFAFPEL